TVIGQPADDPLFPLAAAALIKDYPGVAALQLSISWLHGDCKMDNFMATRDSMFGIDYSLAHENAIEHDVAQFLNNFELLIQRMRFHRLAPIASMLIEAFMRGYHRTAPPISREFLS